MIFSLLAFPSFVLKTRRSCFLNYFFLFQLIIGHICAIWAKFITIWRASFIPYFIFKSDVEMGGKRESAIFQSKICPQLQEPQVKPADWKKPLGQQAFWWQIHFIAKVCAFCQMIHATFFFFFLPIHLLFPSSVLCWCYGCGLKELIIEKIYIHIHTHTHMGTLRPSQISEY